MHFTDFLNRLSEVHTGLPVYIYCRFNVNLWNKIGNVFGIVNRIQAVICQNCCVNFEPSEYFFLLLSSKDRQVLNHFYIDLMALACKGGELELPFLVEGSTDTAAPTSVTWLRRWQVWLLREGILHSRTHSLWFHRKNSLRWNWYDLLSRWAPNGSTQ
jgi:hypothetical protein